jgi:hypothetical protein
MEITILTPPCIMASRILGFGSGVDPYFSSTFKLQMSSAYDANCGSVNIRARRLCNRLHLMETFKVCKAVKFRYECIQLRPLSIASTNPSHNPI